VYKILEGKPEGKRPHRRPRCRCDGTDLRYIGREAVELIHMAQDRDQNIRTCV
jgi:hypothetical protein